MATTKITKRAAREAAALAAQQQADQAAIAAVTMPTQAQLDAEADACRLEEAANLAKEAADLAAEAAVPARTDGYSGPMLALRERLRQGAYSKAANGQPCCGDAIANALGGLKPEQVIRACIVALALPGNPYLGLNIGQQSMNLRNKLRGAMKRGEFGMGVVVEAVEQIVDEDAEARIHAAAVLDGATA